MAFREKVGADPFMNGSSFSINRPVIKGAVAESLRLPRDFYRHVAIAGGSATELSEAISSPAIDRHLTHAKPLDDLR